MRLLFVIIIVTLLSACEAVNAIKIMTANSSATPVWQAPTSKIYLNAVYIGEKPYFKAKVKTQDNQTQELLFLIDTGAPFSVLNDSQAVKKMQLPRGYEIEIAGWGEGKNSIASQVTIEQFDMGQVLFNQLDLALIPIAMSDYFLRSDEAIFDGVIGYDIMKHFSWTFDRANKTIAIANKPHVNTANAQVLKFDRFFGKISIMAQVDFGQNHRAKQELVIDTGSRHYLKMSSAYHQAMDIPAPKTTVTAADFGLSGKAVHQRFALNQLSLGDIKLNHIKTNLIKSEDADDWWVLGNATMGQFVTTIDYLSDTLYLQQVTEFKSRFNLLGLELRKIRSGDYVVRYIMPQMAAANADIKVGDIVWQFNEKPAKEVSTEQMLELANTQGNQKLCVRRSQKEKCIDLQLKPVMAYSTH